MNMCLSQTCMHWLLFVAMAFTVPTFYLLFVVGGWVPYVGLIVIVLRDITVPASLFFLVGVVHLTVYGWLLFAVAGCVARGLSRKDLQMRKILLLTILAMLLFISLIPLYGLGHGGRELHTAYGALMNL